MHQDIHTRLAVAQEKREVSKGWSDSILLRYMACRLRFTLRQVEPSRSLRRTPFQVYTLQERGERTHRIAIYQAEHLRLQSPLAFVGFMSARQKQLRPSIVQAIQHTDWKLVEELAGAPGVLSYSSFELRNGDWCNLVYLSMISGANFSSGSGPAIPLNVSLLLRFGGHVTTKKGLSPRDAQRA